MGEEVNFEDCNPRAVSTTSAAASMKAIRVSVMTAVFSLSCKKLCNFCEEYIANI
jgi:hypothetical protein